jgi:hypothetical protein
MKWLGFASAENKFLFEKIKKLSFFYQPKNENKKSFFLTLSIVKNFENVMRHLF